MKDPILNRRKLLAVLAASSSTIALGGTPLNLRLLLQASDGERKVRSILEEQFSPDLLRGYIVRDFYQSLLVAQNHRENQQFFLEHLDSEELHARLEIYVIEEFFVSTNYLSLSTGQESELRLLPSS